MMKRLFEEKEMARVLLLVSSRGSQAMPMPMPMPMPVPVPVPVGGPGDRALGAPAERAFVCKTCDRVFPSFQALGGHRASHKKPRLDGEGGDLAKPKLHGCSVCGLEFAVGQALGGHMRRHRAAAMASPPAPETTKTVEKHRVGIKRALVWLDLNHPPCGEDGDFECDADGGECGRDMAAAAKLTFHQFLDTGTMAVDCVGY